MKVKRVENFRCYKCDEYKDPSEFAAKRNRANGMQDECRACHSALNAEHYLRNKDYYVKKAATNRYLAKLASLEFIARWFPRRCDCCPAEITAEKHRKIPRSSRTPITPMSLRTMAGYGWSLARIDEEIGRSRLVCSGCFRKHRTLR